jgi:hypothetical protein
LSRLPDEFHQDRALRDAARGVLMADIEHARATLNGKGLADRVAGRVGDGAKDVFEIAKHHASDKRGILAGLVALIALWFAREPIGEILRNVFGGLLDEASDQPGENGASEQPDGASQLDADDRPADDRAADETASDPHNDASQAPESQPETSAPSSR